MYAQAVTINEAAETAPDYTAMQFDFAERVDGAETRSIIMLGGEDAGDLRTVLAAMRNYLQAAGFTYVSAVAVETDAGTIIFSDEA
jgi:hypothetical protein